MKRFASQCGFTLIEMVIYIALFSIIMTGSLAAAYQLISSSAHLDKKITTEEEGAFVLHKLRWALSGASSISSPSASASYSSMITVNKYNYDKNPITIRFNRAGSSIEITEGASGEYLPLTTANVTVNNMGFAYIASSGGTPAGMHASTTINGSVFEMTAYLQN